ncbi:MAG: outer membrane channel protein [Syntrophaceae bacterium PtaU1.Bin231]|nr:MAG: outer membrane channel protein [Syntrophaceae bacterium PtaU1.Bin231]HOG17241.1 TolC family protein [Syntrophales bacterium]
MSGDLSMRCAYLLKPCGGPLRVLAAFFVFMGLACAAGAAETAIREGEELTLERCIEIAVGNQPSIRQFLHASRASEAVLGQARSSYYPQVDLRSGVTRYNAVTQHGDLYPPQSLYGYRYFDSSVNLQQKVYDFGKREGNVDVARLNVDAARSDMDNEIASVVNGVKSAYYGVLRSRKTRDVAAETRDQYLRQLAQAKLFLEAGTKPKYDVTAAEVLVGNAEISLLRAENDLDIAWVALNNAMGYEGAARYSIREAPPTEPYAIAEEEALEQAYGHRSDLQSLLAQREAARRTVEVARKDYFPSLDASAGYGAAGSESPLSQGWNVGVTLSWNLFKGYATEQEIARTAALLRVVEARISALKLQIRQEIKRALLEMKRARETIGNAGLQVRQAAENLELANLRYSSGLGTPLEVADAVVAYSSAKLTQISAEYDLILAQANIERAMGRR